MAEEVYSSKEDKTAGQVDGWVTSVVWCSIMWRSGRVTVQCIHPAMMEVAAPLSKCIYMKSKAILIT